MRIATRGCSVDKGPDELASRRESGDLGKEPRHNHCRSVEGGKVPSVRWKLSQHVCSGETSGSTIVPACSPQYTPLFASRACDTVETGLI